MTETLIPVGASAELCAEVFGAESAPRIVLIAGAGSSMDGWDPEFCRRLADGGRRVIRYDHRDTGRSTLYPVGEPGYRSSDLVADAVAVIDTLAGGQAHVVGLSMGGMLAQQIAVNRPEKVLTMTLVDTSPAGPGPANGLPAMAPELLEWFGAPHPPPDPDDLDAVTENLLDGERAFAGPGRIDEDRTRAACRRAAERTPNRMASAENHFSARDDLEDTRPRLGELTVPTLVVHGTHDLMFPPGHAEAFVREIPGARLLLLEDGGHQAPAPRHWDVVVQELLEHTAGR